MLKSRRVRVIAWVGLALNVILTYLRAVIPAEALGLGVEVLWKFNSIAGPVVNVITIGFALVVALVQRRIILGLAPVVTFFSFFVIAIVHLGICEIWKFFFWDSSASGGSGAIPPFWACQFMAP